MIIPPPLEEFSLPLPLPPLWKKSIHQTAQLLKQSTLEQSKHFQKNENSTQSFSGKKPKNKKKPFYSLVEFFYSIFCWFLAKNSTVSWNKAECGNHYCSQSFFIFGYIYASENLFSSLRTPVLRVHGFDVFFECTRMLQWNTNSNDFQSNDYISDLKA